MIDHTIETSPRLKARIAGALYLISGTLFVRGMPVVTGDAAATAHNILAHETFFRLGFVADLLSAPCYIAVTLLLYDLLRPVNRSLALLATVFSLVGSTIGAVDCLFHLAPLIVLGGSRYLSVFSMEQLQALAPCLSTFMLRDSTSAWCFSGSSAFSSATLSSGRSFFLESSASCSRSQVSAIWPIISRRSLRLSLRPICSPTS